jgi:hypothetical protein
MAIKDIQTTKNDLQEYLLLIAKVPEKVSKIDIDIKKELLIDIDNRISSISKTICGMIVNNPHYQYPENCLPDKLFDYWSSRVSQLFNINELKSLKAWIEKSIEQSKVNIGTSDLEAKGYKKEVWFFVGLWIATGELENLLIEHKNPTRLAKKLYPLQWSSYKTYIGDSRRGDKIILRNTNIFSDDDKITKLYNHCIENNLKIVKSFEDFYNKIER